MLNLTVFTFNEQVVNIQVRPYDSMELVGHHLMPSGV